MGSLCLFEDASEAAGPGYAVALRKLDGTLPVRLGEGSAGRMSPDGKWAISISTGQPQQLTLLPIGAGQPRADRCQRTGTHSQRLGPLPVGWAKDRR